jgi:hypothetical protein
MSDPDFRDDAGAIALLLHLAARGRVAAVQENSDGEPLLSIIGGKGKTNETVARHPLSDLAAAQGRGFVVQGAQGGWVLAPAGREHLRRLRLERTLSRAAEDRIRPGAAAPMLRQRANTSPARNEEESPLAWLRSRLDKHGRPLVDDAQFEAGERLRSDLWLAGLTPRVTSSWSGLPGRGRRSGSPGAGREMADSVVAARQRVSAALAAVGGELSGVLIDVCGHLKGLSEIERREGWPQRSAKLILCKALNALARHYGLLRADTPADIIARRVRHWGAEGYRPSLERWKARGGGPA